MATTTLESLSAADQADFTKRLGTYGLNATAVIQPDLVVPANSKMTLSASDAKSFVKPHVLTTADLDVLKTWIGVPDTLYTAGKLDVAKVVQPKSATPAPITSAATATAAQLDDLATAASAYVFGRSNLTASYKSAVEKYFGNFQVSAWPFLTITVNAGGVLTIGPGQNVLVAWKVLVQAGGQISMPNGGGLAV